MKRAQLGESGNFVQSDTGYKILKSRTVWLRNSMVLNDYSEVEYGDSCLRYAWESCGLGSRLQMALNTAHENLGAAVWADYNSRFLSMRYNTYMMCVSEHPASEDEHGRLSMWRAYGGRSGVAIVVDKSAILGGPHTVPGVTSSPVAYFGREQFAQQFEKIVAAYEEKKSLLASYDPHYVRIVSLRALQFASLSTKHPGFQEKEWRLLYLPHELGNSPDIKEEYETIYGVPQTVHKLPIKDMSVVRRIIVGPCDHPLAVRNAMSSALGSHGIADADSRVVVSNIPLRHSAQG